MMIRVLSAALGVLVLAKAAVAADLYTGPAPRSPVIVPTYTWTGFYVGANAGAAWDSFNISDTLTGTGFGSNSVASFVGGGQAGFNYQISPFIVLGVDVFFDGVLRREDIGGVAVPGIGLVTASAEPNWITTVSGRIGFTGPSIHDWLFYGKFGGAWVEANEGVTSPFGIFSASQTLSGWMVGVGVDWAFAPGWIARLDYQYIGLQDTTLAAGAVVPDTFNTRNANIQTLTLGASYLFNWWGPTVGYQSY